MKEVFTLETEEMASCAHALRYLPKDHKCGRTHGHNVVLKVKILADILDEKGMVMDFGEIKKVVDELDHTDLNLIFTQPTSELVAQAVARTIADKMGKRWLKIEVKAEETPKHCAKVTLYRESP